MVNIKFNFDEVYLNSQDILGSKNFLAWHKKFTQSGCNIDVLKLSGYVRKDKNEFRSLLFEVFFTTPEGNKQIGTIHIRGRSVIIIPRIHFKSGIIKYLVVEQRRVADGSHWIEFPAGSIDDGESSLEAAQRELFEECGIVVDQDKLLLLEDNFLISQSYFDETIDWFYCDIPSDVLPDYELNSFGKESEGEDIRVKLVMTGDIEKLKSFHHKAAAYFIKNYF